MSYDTLACIAAYLVAGLWFGELATRGNPKITRFEWAVGALLWPAMLVIAVGIAIKFIRRKR